MPSFTVLKALFRELVTRERSPRVPEPDLIMDDPEKVAAFERAGREDGVLASVYLFHAAHVSEVVAPGETAVDLGCGPANQLGLIARLNPETRFIGVDLSNAMLSKAEDHIRQLDLDNVQFRSCDITSLSFLTADSVDAVFSTVALHHLPTVQNLDQVFCEVARVLRPGGGLYIVDFGHLKSEKSIRDMALLDADRQPELFTIDYLASLRAAFHFEDWQQVSQRHFNGEARLFSTFLAPYMVALKSARRRDLNPLLSAALRSAHQQLTPRDQRALKDLVAFFGKGGMESHFIQAALRRSAAHQVPAQP